jgi:hypothetical protein
MQQRAAAAAQVRQASIDSILLDGLTGIFFYLLVVVTLIRRC